jgi:Flp pilus assembly protein TadG
MGILGVSVDIGRLYIAKNETQVYADAAALAAVTQFNGATTGLTAARNAAAAAANSWNLNSSTATTGTLEFGTTSAGPWVATPTSGTGYSYARATLAVQMPLFFLPVVVSRYQQQVVSVSVASQEPINSFSVGLSPYSLVAGSSVGPNFGLNPGGNYTIQWPAFNNNKFVRPPCDGDSQQAISSVKNRWGSATNGYWGFSSNSDITQSVLNGRQTAPITIGQNILPIMTNGNKAAQAMILDTRANQDQDLTSQTPDAYMQTSNSHNGRRIMVVPILSVDSDTVTTVVGWGAVLLYTNGSNSNYYKQTNGNEPFCAVYMGPYVVGSTNSGGATSGSGAYRPRLVQ